MWMAKERNQGWLLWRKICFSKSDEEKNNGVKWKDLEVDILIAIQGEMYAKFSKRAKKEGMFLIFLGLSKSTITIEAFKRPWP